MLILVVKLEDIILDPERAFNLRTMGQDDAVKLIKQHYGFLADDVEVRIEADTATIAINVEANTAASREAHAKASEFATQGNYRKAIPLFERALAADPTHKDARRDYAMALLETGDENGALEHLIDVLRQDPCDAWTLLLVGNIFYQHKHDLKTAETYYRSALTHKPDDRHALANLAAVLAKTERTNEAKDYFEKAIEASPDYPNPYHGLALLNYRQRDLSSSLEILDRLFKRPLDNDRRSAHVYSEARKLFAKVNEELAEQTQVQAMESAYRLKEELQNSTGVAVELMKDERLQFPEALCEFAWTHGREYHLLRYRVEIEPCLLPHILAHEMKHIEFEANAFTAGRSRSFSSNDKTTANAHKAMNTFIAKMKRKGRLSPQYEKYLESILKGLCSQLFNCPIDMFIERQLFDQYSELRPAQFLSLQRQHVTNLKVLSDPKYIEVTPELIMTATHAMNCASALFADWLYENKTEYAAPYKIENVYPIGNRLFKVFLESWSNYKPGDEYDLVDEFARILKVKTWYEWLPARAQSTDENVSQENSELSKHITNPDLLTQRTSEAVAYCLDALNLFTGMSHEKIHAIVSEIGIIGMDGLDYSSPEEKYSVNTLGGKGYCGLHLMALMYVGFKRIEPSLDTGIPLDKEYRHEVDPVFWTGV